MSERRFFIAAATLDALYTLSPLVIIPLFWWIGSTDVSEVTKRALGTYLFLGHCVTFFVSRFLWSNCPLILVRRSTCFSTYSMPSSPFWKMWEDSCGKNTARWVALVQPVAFYLIAVACGMAVYFSA